MRWRRPAAAAYKLRTRLDESFRKLRHVLRRAHVKLSPLHVARESGVWLRRKLLLRHLAHAFERVEDDCWSNTAVQTDDVGAPVVESFSEEFGRRAKQRVAVGHDRHLRDDREVAQFADRGDRLADF